MIKAHGQVKAHRDFDRQVCQVNQDSTEIASQELNNEVDRIVPKANIK
jgi:hypothetical protein